MRNRLSQVHVPGRVLDAIGVVALAIVIGLGSAYVIGAREPSGPRQQPVAAQGPDSGPDRSKVDRPGAGGVPIAVAPEPTAVVDDQPSAATPRPAVVAPPEEDVAPDVGPVGPPIQPSSPPPTPVPTPTDAPASVTEVGRLKAVVIVGPSPEWATNLERAEEFALAAEADGMDVRRVYHPLATWDNVLADIQGANLVAYLGHGNSWPSPYGPFQERTKDGFGLNTYAGSSEHEVTYYGANFIRKRIVLAPNAIVALSHLCYSAGNAEPELPIPDWDTAWQRVDNYASGFLYAGARAVFAYGTGSITPIVKNLFKTDKTMDEIFMTRGARPLPYYGFTGWDNRYFESSRMPGYRNHLDPGKAEGFLRAVTGDLDMTTADWRAGAGD